MSCSKDQTETDKQDEVELTILDTLVCNESTKQEGWIEDNFNSEFTISYTEYYERMINADPYNHKLTISKDSFKTAIQGGFCHGTILPCYSVDYGGSVPIPTGDTILSHDIMIPVHLKKQFAVCENEMPTVLFFYSLHEANPNMLMTGSIFVVYDGIDSLHWAGTAQFYSRDEQEVLDILGTLKKN